MDTFTILWRQLNAMWVGAVATVPNVVIATVILIVTWGVAKFGKRIADRLTRHAHMRASLRELVETLISIAIWVVGLMVAATVVLPGLTPASLLAGLGIGTVAIGFAFQDIFQNFLAGVLIMLRRKMRIGDVICCEGIEGRVEHIMLRETHVRAISGELTIVPNSVLFKNPVQIMTDDTIRRHEIVVGVGYDVDLDAAQAVIVDAVRSCDLVQQDKPVEAYAREFGASSIDFTVRWWAGSKPVDMHKSRDQAVRAIKRALDARGMEIPYPYVTNTFKEPLRLARAPREARDAAMREAAE